MLSEEEMWKGIKRLCNEEVVINSLSGSSHHNITAFSSASKSYTITYGSSGKSIDADFSKVYKMYSMLCGNGRLFNKDMENGGHDEIGIRVGIGQVLRCLPSSLTLTLKYRSTVMVKLD